jgi:hypothetical protein
MSLVAFSLRFHLDILAWCLTPLRHLWAVTYFIVGHLMTAMGVIYHLYSDASITTHLFVTVVQSVLLGLIMARAVRRAQQATEGSSFFRFGGGGGILAWTAELAKHSGPLTHYIGVNLAGAFSLFGLSWFTFIPGVHTAFVAFAFPYASTMAALKVLRISVDTTADQLRYFVYRALATIAVRCTIGSFTSTILAELGKIFWVAVLVVGAVLYVRYNAYLSPGVRAVIQSLGGATWSIIRAVLGRALGLLAAPSTRQEGVDGALTTAGANADAGEQIGGIEASPSPRPHHRVLADGDHVVAPLTLPRSTSAAARRTAEASPPYSRDDVAARLREAPLSRADGIHAPTAAASGGVEPRVAAFSTERARIASPVEPARAHYPSASPDVGGSSLRSGSFGSRAGTQGPYALRSLNLTMEHTMHQQEALAASRGASVTTASGAYSPTGRGVPLRSPLEDSS